MVYPIQQTVTDEQKPDLERKIELGLIDGEITDGNLVVRSEKLPWARVSRGDTFAEMNKVYEELYPGSLDNLGVPREALLDAVAWNYHKADRWNEWLERQKSS